MGHEVEIINVRPRKLLFAMLGAILKGRRWDWVFVHHERMVPVSLMLGRLFRFKTVFCSHRPVTYLGGIDAYSSRVLKIASRAKYHVCLNESLALAMKVLNPSCDPKHLVNGVEVDEFRIAPSGEKTTICIGGISPRKRQKELIRAVEGTGVEVDLVGPADHSNPEVQSVVSHPWYKGTWSREEVYDRLTDYKVLVLFSESEGQPLVVVEALAAGCCVVVSKQSASNLDLSKPFIRVVESPHELPDAIRELAALNDSMRDEIRKYASETFHWDKVVGQFVGYLSEWDKK